MNFWQDIRFGLRSLKKTPGFTLVAALALALGIGPNAALFSVVYAAFFDSTGYPAADRMVEIGYSKGGASSIGVAVRDFQDFQRQATVFESLSAKSWGPGLLGDGDDALQIQSQTVTAGLLTKTYGFFPALGRDFLPEETETGKDVTAILSYRFWETQFAKDPAILGKKIRLSGQSYTVVGVMPASRRNTTQVWTPLQFTNQGRGTGEATVTGRLKSGVSIVQAQVEMSHIARDLAATYPATNASLTISVQPFRGNLVPVTTKTTLWLLTGTVSFILLIACANLASLMVAKGTSRRREIGIRVSLGASPIQVLRQLALETLFVSLAGAAAGAALGWALLKIMVVQIPSVIALSENEPTLSVPVLIATAAIGLIAGILFGSLPLWRAARQNLDDALKMGGPSSAGRSRVRLRRLLVTFEFAAATTLLAAAAICMHSLWLKTRTNLGIEAPEKLLVFSFITPVRNSPPGSSAAENILYRENFSNGALNVVRAVPGVLRATRSDTPLSAGMHMPFEIEGQPPPNQDNRPKASIFNVSDGYFETVGIRVSRGRAIDEHDSGGTEDVAMVNEEFVRRFLPDRDPLGAFISPDQMTAKGMVARKRRIVGVFATIKRGRVSDWPEPEIAVPNGQGSSGSSISVRIAGDPNEFRVPILQALKTFGAMTRGMKPETVDQLAANMVVRERGYAIVFGALAGLALLLSAVGIYGVMSFMVAQRTREIGVRMALGATRERIVSLIFREGMLLAVIGMVIGLLGASSVSSAFQAVLLDAKVLPYGAFGTAAVVLLICAACACGVPAYRASEVDPVNSLRAE